MFGYLRPMGDLSWLPKLSQLDQRSVRTVDFRDFNGTKLPASMRIFGPNASVAQDIEPEYITVSHDSRTAWVTLQENSAIATIDLATAKVTKLAGLGFKDHSEKDHFAGHCLHRIFHGDCDDTVVNGDGAISSDIHRSHLYGVSGIPNI